MKITDVEVLILEAPGDYAAPAGAEEAYGFKHLALLRVHTDEGITGIADVESQPHVIKAIVEAPRHGGDLFSGVRGKPVPDFAKDFECASWAQFFLKWIVASTAVTCAIPATNNVHHLEDNMRGGIGRLPDGKTRARMVEVVSAL